MLRESARLTGRSLGPSLAIRYAYGLTKAEIERGVYRPGHGVTGRVLQTGEATIAQDIDEDPDYLARAVERDRLPDETVSYIPLRIHLYEAEGRTRVAYRLAVEMFKPYVNPQIDVLGGEFDAIFN